MLKLNNQEGIDTYHKKKIVLVFRPLYHNLLNLQYFRAFR